MGQEPPSRGGFGVWKRLALAAGVAGVLCLLMPGARVLGVLLVGASLAVVGLAAAADMQRGMAEEEDEFLSGVDPTREE